MKKLLFLIILLQNNINCDGANIYGNKRFKETLFGKKGELEKQKEDDKLFIEYRNAVLKNSGIFAAGAVIGGVLVTGIITSIFMKSFAKSFTW
jgi:hypothetical protein